MLKYLKSDKKGFTLIEIMTVISILSILIGVTVPNFYILIRNTKEKENLSIAKNIYVSTQDTLNDIIMGKHTVTFNKTNNKEITEKEYDYSKNYKINNNNFIINDDIKTPIKIILANGNYINGTNYTKWEEDFKKEFFNNVEITYNYENFAVKSISYKGVIYSK
ncbi:type II secretion system protein [uncultured Tyzzerella sp.]|uniref:type II secretion system protein n=1 Tax=uncultured Tyzzerella sp. TaxID=2321398 RepID=UPI00294323C3|nr:type II secretion system protein [uncultured Tyzzerella sp.]